MHLVDPPSPDYVPNPKEPEQVSLLPDYVPRKYPEYLAPSDAEIPVEDQPHADDASPIDLSPGYIANSDQKEEEEAFKEDKEEEHLAPANFTTVPLAVDPVGVSMVLEPDRTVQEP
nr:hypothetical protein [Tanacetum cinerariifolium]